MEQSDALEKLWNLIKSHRNVSLRSGSNAVNPAV
jgi:hypothetical protein